MSEQETPPKWMKFSFDDEEHRVWESVFPTTNPPMLDDNGKSVRRRRPSPIYMAKIIRSLAELGVYPVFRSTVTGEIVPWDVTHEPQQSWRLDPGIYALLGNLAKGSDPNSNVEAYYHPADLVAHFGANPNQWTTWPVGMTGVRVGPRRDDVSIGVTLDTNNLEYLRKRNILKRPQAKTRLVSTGGVAFFAAAAVSFWNTADDRARIGRLKTKLAVDFHVLRNSAPLPEDPAIRDLITGGRPNDVVGAFLTDRPLSVPSRRELGLPEHDRQVPLLEVAALPQPHPLNPEDELRQLEARMVEVRRLIEANNLEEKRRRHASAVDSVHAAFMSAKVSAVDIRTTEFDPSNPDHDPSQDVRVDGIIISFADGREFSFGRGTVIAVPTPEEDAERAAFEANPIGYTFGG